MLDSLRSVDGSLRLDCLRPSQALFGEVSLLDVEPCIDQYATLTLGLNTYSLGGLSVECYLVCEYTQKRLSGLEGEQAIKEGSVTLERLTKILYRDVDALAH